MRQWIAGLLGCAMASMALANYTVDQIVDKNIQARGGSQRWQAIRTVRIVGQMAITGNVQAPVRLEFKRPNKLRMEFDVDGETGVQAYDGTTGWSLLPFSGMAEPMVMSEEQRKEIAHTADFDGPLIDYRDKGHQLKLIGQQVVDGRQAYVLELQRRDGQVTLIYLDGENFLEFKQTTTAHYLGQQFTVHTTIGDYRDVDGIVMPHRLEVSFEGMDQTQGMVLHQVEFDVAIDDARFMLPRG